ncbi:MAG: haloacid dehalogenase, partial [Alphaproteobacteria bacterium]
MSNAYADPASADRAHANCSNGAHGQAGVKAIDPVCGMTVDPTTTAHRASHEGTEHFFCSAGCRTKFIADPDKYLGDRPEPEPASPGTIYTCPQHHRRRQGELDPVRGLAGDPHHQARQVPPH